MIYKYMIITWLGICNTRIRQTKEMLGKKSLKILKLEREFREEDGKVQHSRDFFFLTWKRGLRKLNIFVLSS